MHKFIELKSNDETYFINVSHIVMVTPGYENKTRVFFTTLPNNWRMVDDDRPYPEVVKLITG